LKRLRLTNKNDSVDANKSGVCSKGR